MWLMLLLLVQSADAHDEAHLRLRYGQPISRLIYPYVQCVTEHDGKIMPPKGVRLAFHACRATRREVLAHALAERSSVERALSDFEKQYAQFTLRNTDLRDY